jgi:hypothetical protein
VGDGKTILEFQKDQTVFAQGEVADTVFLQATGLHREAIQQL